MSSSDEGIVVPRLQLEIASDVEGAGIELAEFVNAVIESRAKIVTDFANQDRSVHRYCDAQEEVCSSFIHTSRVFLKEDAILLARKRGEKVPQINKVFICPADPMKGAIERVSDQAIIGA